MKKNQTGRKNLLTQILNQQLHMKLKLALMNLSMNEYCQVITHLVIKK